MQEWQPGQPWQPPPPKPPENALAIVGLVCSISGLGFLFVLAPLTLGFSMVGSGPLVIAGLVCGLLGRQKVDRGELPTGRGIAQAAFVLGIIGVVLHVLAVLIGVVLLGLVLDSIDNFDIPEPDSPPGPGDPTPPGQDPGPPV